MGDLMCSGGRPEVAFTMSELLEANERWGCNCGPGALAALLRIKPDQLRPYLHRFESVGFMQRDDMKQVLDSLELGFQEVRAALPPARYGVNRVQFHGPWMKPGVPYGARYRYTHWIASQVADGVVWVFDVNTASWETLEHWRAETLPQLVAGVKRADGFWSLTCKLEVSL